MCRLATIMVLAVKWVVARYNRELVPKSDRELGTPTHIPKNPNNEPNKIRDAIHEWSTDLDRTKSGIFIIDDSQIYLESFEEIKLPAGTTLEIRAGQNQRPVIKLTNSLMISGADKPIPSTNSSSMIILDGLLIDRSNENENFPLISIKQGGGDLRSLTVQHCTLIPERDTSNTSSTTRKTSLEVESNGQLSLCSYFKPFNWWENRYVKI